MGLTNESVGMHAVDSGLMIKKQTPEDRVIAIAGNPNVGKSTLFNNLTGMNQHTGNWPGKTVSNAQGYCATKKRSYVLVDIPGTYSLMAHSAEEEVARNFICFGHPDAVAVVCDATCLERNLNLVLQTLEITDRVIVCVNLMDEAERKHIKIDLKGLSDRLGVPVVGITARKKKTLTLFLKELDEITEAGRSLQPYRVTYAEEIERAVSVIEPVLRKKLANGPDPRWVSLRLLDFDESLLRELNETLGEDLLLDGEVSAAIERAKALLGTVPPEDLIVSGLVAAAEEICKETVRYDKSTYHAADRRIDRVLTGKRFGYPVMILLLAFILWLTITGANYPSQLLSDGLFWIQD